MPNSVLFVPSLQSFQWLNPCADYSYRHGYEVEGVVSVWDDILNLILDGWRGVAVAGDRSHVPADRLPRWEFVSEEERALLREALRRTGRTWAAPR